MAMSLKRANKEREKEREKAEKPKPPPSENAAAKRKREERARETAWKHNEKVHRTGQGMAIPAPERKGAGAKFKAPTSPRLLKSGLGTWQREKTPSDELDGKQMEQLKRRRRMTEKRAQTKAERQLQADFCEDGVDSGNDSGDDEVAVAAPAAEGKPPHSL